MLKNLYVGVVLVLIACFLCPLNFIKCEVTITEKEKSAGEFLTVMGADVSSFINASGISFNLTRNQLQNLIKSVDGKEVHSFSDGEILNIYYYSKKIPIKEVIKNKRVNIHVALSNGNVKVGIPFIYYGY